MDRGDRYIAFARTGEQFARRVAERLSKEELDPERDAFFGFDTGCLETLQWLKPRGIFTVVDQIDPARYEDDLVREEAARRPGWEPGRAPIPEAYWARLRAEWNLADVVLVNSAWSKIGLVQQGVPASKVVVVPLAYEAPERPREPRRSDPSRPLQVLWVASVVLRKGIAYLLEAARQLEGEPVSFVVAGGIGISEEAVRSAPSNVKFLGQVTRDRTAELYRSADVYVLPTLSDGFAITQLEAMAHGLPVVTTPNCGEVVTEGEDGFIVPARDAQALAGAVLRFVRDRSLVEQMSRKALEKSTHFTLDHYTARLDAELAGRLPAQARRPRTRRGDGEWQPQRWSVSQLGARQHYAVPRVFNRRGELRHLYTDAWCRTGRPLLGRGPRLARSLAGRFHRELLPAQVIDFTLQSASLEVLRRSSGATSGEGLYRYYVAQGEQFARRVAEALSKEELDPERDAFFGFDTGCLETLQWLKPRGIFTVVDQIDPARYEDEIVREEAALRPGWEPRRAPIPEAYWERLRAEWELADVVLVNSPWSKASLVKQGVPVSKVVVVPLAYEAPERPREPRRSDPSRPLQVLWVASVVLRKGIAYLLEAARQLEGEPVSFVVAGGIGISEEAVRSAPSNVKFLGQVTRDRTTELYRGADVYVLPTLSDGFAITQLEAMAHGLPVVTTPNCGEVVTEGEDGFIVPARDAQALAGAVLRFVRDRSLVEQMSRKALEKSTHFTLDHYAGRIYEQLRGHR